MVARFVCFLERADQEVRNAECEAFPDTNNPNSEYRFRKTKDVMVAYKNDNPVWYWKMRHGAWEIHRIVIDREIAEADW